jgi:Zn-dependent peptidase ImmA (M78 family)/transcriptional regulator with XRE-family HTH domain
MTLPPMEKLDPKALAARLQQARRAARRTQQEAADLLSVARTTITAIEKGERRVQPEELVRLAEFYHRPISELTRQGMPSQPFAPRLRAILSEGSLIAAELEPWTWVFQRLCEDYVELEKVCNAPLPRRYPSERRFEGVPPTAAAEDLSVSERQRLGLGDGPLGSLRDLLEQEVGLRVFYLDLPAAVSGMFAFDEALGGCIAVNLNHREDRRRNSLLHEYAHFLTARFRSVVDVSAQYRRNPDTERLANAFAPAFLIPRTGVTRRVNQIKAAKNGDFTFADLATLANYYAVSLESLTRRLEDLRLLRGGSWERLKEEGFRPDEARSILGLEAPTAPSDVLPTRYLLLSMEALRTGKISEGQFSRFLRVDRAEGRRIAAGLSMTTDPATFDASRLRISRNKLLDA